MGKYFNFYILFFCSVLVQAQNNIAIWQGFEHHWTYNHRLNRLGDYITQNNNGSEFVSNHTGATGLGKDSAYFNSYFATITNTDLAYFVGKINIPLSGKQGNIIQLKKKIKITQSSNLLNLKNYVAILNGFDITADESADKLQLFTINLGEPNFDKNDQCVYFTIEVILNVDCKSLECSVFNKKFSYNLDIHYLILGGQDHQLNNELISYDKITSWSKENPSQPKCNLETMSINTAYNNGIVAYKSFTILLSKELHYLSYANTIESFNYDKTKQEAKYSMNLFFSNWQEGMKQSVASGGQAKFANKRAGWCIINGDLNFIQFNKGETAFNKRTGASFWIGKNKPANSNQAVNTESYLFK
jgi:hypothetical protein